MLLNSKLAPQMVDSDLHFVDSSDGDAHPATLAAGDFARLAASSALFARKFDTEVDGDILRLIEKRLLGLCIEGRGRPHDRWPAVRSFSSALSLVADAAQLRRSVYSLRDDAARGA